MGASSEREREREREKARFTSSECVRERERERERRTHADQGLHYLHAAQPAQAQHKTMKKGGWQLTFLNVALMLITLLGCIIILNCGRAVAQTGSSSGGVDSCLQQTCGSLSVSYPFRLSSNAHCPSFSSFFDLNCSLSGQDLYLPINVTSLNYDPIPIKVLEIGANNIIIDVTSLKASITNTCDVDTTFQLLHLKPFPSPFVFSQDNRFATFGCSSLGFLVGVEHRQNTYTSETYNLSNAEIGGCYTLCPGDEVNPECGNHSCCVSKLPQDAYFREIEYYVSHSSFSYTNDANQCKAMYSTIFHDNYTDFTKQIYGVNLSWALPSNHTESTTDIEKSPNYACSKHSNITIVKQVPGYLCSCPHGFEGDGYAQGHVCADIDECVIASLNDCIPGKSKCYNKEGSYMCKCNSKYYVGDGLRSGSGCTFSPDLRNALAIVAAIVFVGLMIGGVVVFAIWWKRRVKRKYFLLNGGLELQDLIVKAGGKRESRLFTAEELKAATENYAEHMKLGMGGFGTVYKGILANGQLVAIKKANLAGGGNEQFLNELQILLHTNHRNIVRLLGCCMETPVPLLVYEYVSHGTVRQNLDAHGTGVMDWEQRLKVAKQTAEALAYLHAAAFPPILHRDVKSANVLLDANLDAKVADFGVSRLVTEGMQHVSTAVQGTIGYLDPEYFQTLQLTDKSDVYGLGVMLVELISGQKPIDNRTREPRYTSLAVLFIECMQEGRGEELIDPCLMDPSALSSDKSWDMMLARSSIMAVAALALQCLSMHGADRPSMSILVDELHRIAYALKEPKYGKDTNKDSPLVSSNATFSQHVKAGAVVARDDEVFVQSVSNSMSISTIIAPTSPR